MSDELLATLVVIGLSAACMLLFQPLARHWKLLDQPDERKHHDGAVPLVGGLSIYIGLLGAHLLMPRALVSDEIPLLAAGLLLVIGLLDDFQQLPVRIRFSAQIAAVMLLCLGAGNWLESLGDLVTTGPIDLGPLGLVFTVFAAVGIINAFNMIDGLDGLASGLALITLSAIMILQTLSGASIMPLVILLCVALLPFLAFNLGLLGERHKIFLGDAGSMMLGLIVVWRLIANSQGAEPLYPPVVALWLVAVPLIDTIAVMLRRIRRGDSPFEPDRCHIHHLLVDAGLSPRTVLAILLAAAVLLVVIGLDGAIDNWPQPLLFASFVSLALAYYGLSSLVLARRAVQEYGFVVGNRRISQRH